MNFMEENGCTLVIARTQNTNFKMWYLLSLVTIAEKFMLVASSLQDPSTFIGT